MFPRLEIFKVLYRFYVCVSLFRATDCPHPISMGHLLLFLLLVLAGVTSNTLAAEEGKQAAGGEERVKERNVV